MNTLERQDGSGGDWFPSGLVAAFAPDNAHYHVPVVFCQGRARYKVVVSCGLNNKN